MWSSFIKHQKRRSIHHQRSVGSTRCLAVAGHAQSEWNLYLRWRNASPPLDLNSSALCCGWSVRYVDETFTFTLSHFLINAENHLYLHLVFELCLVTGISVFRFSYYAVCDLDYLSWCMDRYNRKFRYREEHSASPHFSRHFTHWHFPRSSHLGTRILHVTLFPQ